MTYGYVHKLLFILVHVHDKMVTYFPQLTLLPCQILVPAYPLCSFLWKTCDILFRHRNRKKSGATIDI